MNLLIGILVAIIIIIIAVILAPEIYLRYINSCKEKESCNMARVFGYPRCTNLYGLGTCKHYYPEDWYK